MTKIEKKATENENKPINYTGTALQASSKVLCVNKELHKMR